MQNCLLRNPNLQANQEDEMKDYPKQDLRVRTKKFALQVIKMYQGLPSSGEAQVIGNQVLRSGTSVGAQYREACRAKSPADFVNKMEGSLQELDESAYWLGLVGEAGTVRARRERAGP